jgi:hypothetical protein
MLLFSAVFAASAATMPLPDPRASRLLPEAEAFPFPPGSARALRLVEHGRRLDRFGVGLANAGLLGIGLGLPLLIGSEECARCDPELGIGFGTGFLVFGSLAIVTAAPFVTIGTYEEAKGLHELGWDVSPGVGQFGVVAMAGAFGFTVLAAVDPQGAPLFGVVGGLLFVSCWVAAAEQRSVNEPFLDVSILPAPGGLVLSGTF